jgi:hypothetical protein
VEKDILNYFLLGLSPPLRFRVAYKLACISPFDNSICDQHWADGGVDIVGLADLLALRDTFHAANGVDRQA